jgi:phospholipid transport system substrate-binding protein
MCPMARLGNRPRRRVTRRALLLVALGATGWIPRSTAAADNTGASSGGAAAGPIAELNAGLLAQMKAGRGVPFTTRYAQLAPLIERVFDLPLILRASVGLRWDSLGQDDRARLLEAFRSYTICSYLANFDKYQGQRFVILPDQRSVGEKVVVATQIVPSSGTPARIDYVLRQEEGNGSGGWKAVDIMLDGSISQVAVQRSEFYGLLGDGGVAKLITTLYEKVADLSGGALKPPAAPAGAPR